jgi:hypothetical protein
MREECWWRISALEVASSDSKNEAYVGQDKHFETSLVLYNPSGSSMYTTLAVSVLHIINLGCFTWYICSLTRGHSLHS